MDARHIFQGGGSCCLAMWVGYVVGDPLNWQDTGGVPPLGGLPADGESTS